MVKDKKHWKTTTGAAVTIVAFVVTLLVLLRVFSLEFWGELPAFLALGISLALAWVLAAAAGEHLMPLRRSLVLATACLVVAAPLVYWQWEGEEGEGEGPPEAEEVLFKYEASFTYLSSVENESLEGYGVLFPCPTVNGEPVIVKENLHWQLWGPGENDELTLEVDNGEVIRWVGERANSPPDNDFYLTWIGKPFHKPTWREWFSTTWKITMQNDFDNLYRGEMLRSEGYFILLSDQVENTTLRENDSRVLSAHSWLNDDKIPAADVEFWVRLSKQVNNEFKVVEQFSQIADNATEGFFLELH